MEAASARPESWWRAQEPAMAFSPPAGVHDPRTAETWFLWGYPTIEGLTGVPRDGYCCALPTCRDAFYFLRWPLLAGPEAFGGEHAELAVGIEAADDDDADDGTGAWATWPDGVIVHTREHGRPPARSLSGPFTTRGDWEVLRIESLPRCISSHGDAAWWQEHFQEAPIVRDDGGNVQLTGEFLTWIEGELSQDPGFFDGYR